MATVLPPPRALRRLPRVPDWDLGWLWDNVEDGWALAHDDPTAREAIRLLDPPPVRNRRKAAA